jgi:hypothetical protein
VRVRDSIFAKLGDSNLIGAAAGGGIAVVVEVFAVVVD